MKIPAAQHRSGIALIIVMVVIVALGILAGGFAYTMKVETKLARNASFDVEFEWAARSGIEHAKYVLGEDMKGPNAGYDGYNEKWAGGPGSTNDPLGDLPMTGLEVGRALIDVKIEDNDRKFNINVANDVILRQALTLVGVDAAEGATIVDSILDWRDPDDDPHTAGTETETYESFLPPYMAKNGPMDDLTELLLVRGVSPAIYWGSGAAGHVAVLNRSHFQQSNFEEPVYIVGLKDLFTTLSSRSLNLNTATHTTLQVIPFIDENVAQAIITRRAGPDGQDGTEDDMPFRNPGELQGIPGFPQMNMGDPAAVQLMAFFGVRSLVFDVTININIAGLKRTYKAILRRNSARDIQVVNMNWQ
jgi:general secretion pathway protein K